MTFSIAGRCDRTGMFGIAISSSSPAVAARCAHVRAGIGSVLTQNITDPRLGPAGLDLLAQGLDAAAVIQRLVDIAASTADYRQVLVVDRFGGSAAHTGQQALGANGHFTGKDVAAGGNMLATKELPHIMAAAFSENGDLHLGDRLLRALTAGLLAGGEAGPVHSAGLLLTDQAEWLVADLRVDWAEAPLDELAKLWHLWKPQMNDYVTRGLDPTAAPSYGVPGDP